MRRITAALGAFVCVAAVALPAAAKKRNPAAVALVKKAIAASDIEAKGAPAFRLQATVRLFGPNQKRTDGMLVKFWTPAGQQREETLFQGYQLIDVSDGTHEWRKSTVAFVPYKIDELWEALAFTGRLRPWIDPHAGKWWSTGTLGSPSSQMTTTKFGKPEPGKQSGQQCVEAEDKRSPATEVCFAAATDHFLSETDWDFGVTYEYSDYQSFGKKSFPRTMRVLNGGQELAEIHIVRIDPLADPAPELFAPVKGSQEEPVIAACGEVKQPKVVKTGKAPVPPGVSRAGWIGSVLLYMDVGADGVPRGLWVMKSPSATLSAAAGEWVSKWKIEPAICSRGGAKLNVAMRVVVTFKPLAK